MLFAVLPEKTELLIAMLVAMPVFRTNSSPPSPVLSLLLKTLKSTDIEVLPEGISGPHESARAGLPEFVSKMVFWIITLPLSPEIAATRAAALTDCAVQEKCRVLDQQLPFGNREDACAVGGGVARRNHDAGQCQVLGVENCPAICARRALRECESGDARGDEAVGIGNVENTRGIVPADRDEVRAEAGDADRVGDGNFSAGEGDRLRRGEEGLVEDDRVLARGGSSLARWPRGA